MHGLSQPTLNICFLHACRLSYVQNEKVTIKISGRNKMDPHTRKAHYPEHVFPA